MNAHEFESMTDAEMADWQYRHKRELDDDLVEADEVQFDVAEPLPAPRDR